MLCRRAFGCRPSYLPCGEYSFICKLQYVIHHRCVWPIRWDVSSVPCGSPQGVKLLSYLYNEAQNNCSNENYPVLLSLLKSSCEPYTRSVNVLFIQTYGLKTKSYHSRTWFYLIDVQRLVLIFWTVYDYFCCASLRFVSDWVYSGVFRDVYGEFMIQVNEEYLSFRGETHTHMLSHKHFGFSQQVLKMKSLPDNL